MPVKPDEWARIDALFQRAMECPPEKRAALLDHECSGDPSLRKEIESLIRQSDEIGEESFRRAFFHGVAEVVGHAGEVALASSSRSLVGKRIGRYEVISLLGVGGMGAVFLAHDTTLHRRVALKVLGPSGDEEASRTRLLREARNAAALNHPNICTIHEVGEADGTTFIAMEYVEGHSLREHLDRGALALGDALRYGIQASEALAYAHEHGVIHRDFKAANVIVAENGRLTVVDFGLARRSDSLTKDGTNSPTLTAGVVGAGTPYAMAPEQVRGDATDERTDVWALGVLLYEMMGAVKPFSAPTVPDLFSSILRDSPTPLDESIPDSVKGVIHRCLAKEPGQRYQCAKEVQAALTDIETAAGRTISHHHSGYLLHTAIGLALVAIVGFVVLNTGRLRDWFRKPPDAPPITLAVLPFENLTGDPQQEYFSDGLTEELISQLGRLQPGRLRVIARTSSMRYKHTSTPIDQIGRTLRAQYVIEGSARREGGRVRISATLIRVSDQTQRWSDTFDREFAGILGLQRDVSKAVASSLALTLLPGVKDDFGGTKLVHPDAYEAYLAGRSHATKLTRPDLDLAQKYFNLALSKDPRYALGYVGLALVWSGRQQMQFVAPEEAGPQVKAAALKALELDEMLPEAHLTLAYTYAWTDWNWAAAEPEFQRAIELRPNYAEARAYYSHYLYIMKRPAEAEEQIQRAMELDPLSEFVKSFYSVTLFISRRFEPATVQLRDVLETNPNSPMALTGLSESLHYLHLYDDALAAERARWRARGDHEVEEALQRGFMETGYKGAMHRAADLLAVRSATNKVLPLAVAKLYARAGEPDREIEWLEKAVDTHDPNVPYLAVMPIFDDLRGLPRFQRLVASLNLRTD